MTTVYFVRHAQPEHMWEDDSTRPLTAEGERDAEKVLEFFGDKHIDAIYCSPYRRSIDTIKSTAEHLGKEIIADSRLRERAKGEEGNNHGMFRMRWADHDFCEDGGESINMVQRRNIEALEEILMNNDGKSVIIGTHGTALSSILNYYDSNFVCDDFLRIIDWMPYIIELRFDGLSLVGKTEHMHTVKEFMGKKRADK